jgi:hypothetical protein
MIPDGVHSFTTEGERQFYRFLETIAKPDSRYISWYLPDIKGKEPDFLFFSDEVGLIIFEVKDWALNQIREANPQYFVLDIGNKKESRKNPFHQARDYFGYVMDKIKEDGKLVSRDPNYHGNPKFPINCGVVFPNINKYEFIRKGFDQVTGKDRIFFWDDLHSASDICADTSGNCFLKALKDMFAPQFNFKISGREMDHLKHLIFPVVRIELPDRQSENSYEQRTKRLNVLDQNQEAIARKFDGGHRIVTGPSGSGKTLVLVHKAAFLKQYNPAIKNILFVCYNITLVNYIRRLLSDKKVPMGNNGVDVFHFFELCSKIIGEAVAYENEDSEYYDMVVQEALSKLQNQAKKYDAILVDEGQDFSDDMYRVITGLLNKEANNLTIALDENQNLYRRKYSWKDVGVQAQGRIHKISYVYRNTREIAEFANKFISGKSPGSENRQSNQSELFPDFFDFHGSKPELKQFSDYQSIADFISDKIPEIIESEGCPQSEIAILYTMQTINNGTDVNIPQLIQQSLESNGILCNWVSEDYRSKKNYDITTNSVTISTIHSVKGLDYSSVFLVGLDCLDSKRWSNEQISNLSYVAMTRARFQLIIPHIRGNEIIGKLQSCM